MYELNFVEKIIVGLGYVIVLGLMIAGVFLW